MISKNKQKLVQSLAHKKYRDRENLFVAEGPKVVGELMQTFTPAYIVATPDWMEQHPSLQVENETVTAEELQSISLMPTPQQVIALFHKPLADDRVQAADIDCCKQLIIMLDDIQDPGNLGTIVRIAGWFGISHIVCSPHTADVYAPKVVQATMGALARVKVHYTPLTDFLHQLPTDTPVYGTFLEGRNIYTEPLTTGGIVVMGNEGNGISPEVAAAINRRLYIPPYPADSPGIESLNVAIATAITVAEFRRRSL